ncbi:MAG: ribonuclease Z [Crocinitomicaceae bacterium]|nr:ribonuclease Z [Crocinitomicaceae bacterium]
MKFTVTILGSGAATPTLERYPTSQFINCNERCILIDCGEGSQIQMRKYKLKFQKIKVILISHLHGDHYFGLAGLLSSFILLGRTSKLKIICPVGLKEIILKQIEIGNAQIPFEIEFDEILLTEKALVFEDKVLEIYAFPLNHRIPTHGFEIREKAKDRNLIPEKLEEYAISVKEIGEIKSGKPLIRKGKVIPENEYSKAPAPPLSYVFCSDNRIQSKQVGDMKDASLLYHEATFTDKDKSRAKSTFHSTAKEVGECLHQSGIENILLGHFSARYKDTTTHQSECQEYIKNVFCVTDGATYEISQNGVEMIG